MFFITEMDPDLGVFGYIFEVLIRKLWVMYSYLCSVYSDFMSTSEYFLKYDAVIIIYDFILNTVVVFVAPTRDSVKN